MKTNNQNLTGKFIRRSSLSDGHYVSMPDERITIKRLVMGVLSAATLVALFITLAAFI